MGTNKVADKTSLRKIKYSPPNSEIQSKIQPNFDDNKEIFTNKNSIVKNSTAIMTTICETPKETNNIFSQMKGNSTTKTNMSYASSNLIKDGENDLGNEIDDTERFKDILKSQTSYKNGAKRPRCMIMPQDTGKVIWDNIILVAVLYACTVSPFAISFWYDVDS